MNCLYRLIKPLLFKLDAERAHGLAVCALKSGWVPERKRIIDPRLKQSVLGLNFDHPIGLAAGFDKNAEIYNALLGQGFGFVEIGSVTPKPQPGNDKPRLFRLALDQAVINRMGFNNAGMDVVAENLVSRMGHRSGIVGVNLGKNKTTVNAIDDYVLGINRLAPFADYAVINVSSPNTPGLRELQGRDALFDLLTAVKSALTAVEMDKKIPLLLKVAPDLMDDDKQDIVDVALECAIEGLIISNTTIARPENLLDRQSQEIGGLSGRPLMAPSTAVLKDFYKLSNGKLLLIGVGGVSSAEDAYQKIRSGATLVQLYSAMVYQGPSIAGDIARGLADLLAADGFKNVSDAVGVDV